ncbi:MAG: tyrosine-type recombinase/integrase [Oligoflexia bacterium]|nr:tyrosine-type recombinase/integrase [Oligoflexia bacterium]
MIKTDLSAAVPSIAGWRLKSLPRAVDKDIVKKIIQSCDRNSSLGKRDYAILMLLTKMALRAGEVASLELESIRWRDGVILLRGKGNRLDALPLAHDVAKAIIDYLKNGRYHTQSRKLFLSVLAPGPREMSTRSVQEVVKKACKIAGIKEIATHQLRHTVATEMLQQGSTLAEIAQVLRHRSITTTAIYAKVDRKNLQYLAKKWPGGKK